MKKKRRILVTMLLNLCLCGLGHWYLGLRIRALILFCIHVALLGLFWIGAGVWMVQSLLVISFLFGIYVLVGSVVQTRRVKRVTESKTDHVLFYGVVILVWWLGLEVLQMVGFWNNLALRTFSIPTASMENTLMVGDRIIAVKEADINTYELIVFKGSHDTAGYYIKRCVGLPGDTLEAKDGWIYVNRKKEFENPRLKFTHGIQFMHKDELSDVPILLDWNLDVPLNEHGTMATLPDSGVWYTRLGLAEVELLKQELPQLKIFRVTSPVLYEIDKPQPGWTIDHFGPVLVPRKGMTVLLQEGNCQLYYSIILNENPDDEFCYEDGLIYKKCFEHMKSYTFKSDYFYVVGDNRHNSLDSRMWGFLPKKRVYGSVWVVF